MTKPMPFQPASAGSKQSSLQQVERELEPVGLLGVDVEADVVAAGELGAAAAARG